jgi:hypothetical protein
MLREHYIRSGITSLAVKCRLHVTRLRIFPSSAGQHRSHCVAIFQGRNSSLTVESNDCFPANLTRICTSGAIHSMGALLVKSQVCDEDGLTLTGEENPNNVSTGHRKVSTPIRNFKCCGLTWLRTWARDNTNRSPLQGDYVQTETWFTLREIQNMFTKWSCFREMVIVNSTVSYFHTSCTAIQHILY